MTCQEFTGGFVKSGDQDPIDAEMNRFLKDPIERDDLDREMP